VSARDETGERQSDHLFLPEDGPGDLLGDAV